MQFATEDVLQCLADSLSQIFYLLAEHHAFGRVDPPVQLVVLGTEVLARIEHVISQLEA